MDPSRATLISNVEALVVGPVSSANVSAVFIFGDSIFDAGNNHFNRSCSVQADFPPYGSSFFHRSTGRFTNGRTVADFISQFLGIEFQKPFLEAQLAVMNGSRKDYPSNGINFASAGSGVLQATNQDWGVISIQQQLRQFQALVQENQAMLAEVGNLIDQIYKLGARRIALFSLGPVGCVPARALLPGAPVDKCFGKMNLMVKNYNKGLESLVDDMPIQYPGAAGVFGAVYDIVQRFRAIPAQYRFSDVTNACCGDGTHGGLLQCGREGYKICPNPNAFFFWDYFHPTEHAYKLISRALWGGERSRIRPVNLKTLASTP
ncbi:hypothetical protein OIU78_007002 [Salix suchowensis]|nr:hypothetical protein OIU78_007002 [Salix suchowensis]